jgi:hypothetical protein
VVLTPAATSDRQSGAADPHPPAPLPQILNVRLEGTLVPYHLAVPLEGEDVRRDGVEQPPVATRLVTLRARPDTRD